MSRKEKQSAEAKVKIVGRCLAGEIGQSEAGRLVIVETETIRGWIARYAAEGAEGFLRRAGRSRFGGSAWETKKDQTPRTELEKAQIEIEQLKRQLHRTEMERDLLQKLDEVVRGGPFASEVRASLHSRTGALR